MKRQEPTPEGYGSFRDGSRAWAGCGLRLRGGKPEFTTPFGTAEQRGLEANLKPEASWLPSVMIGLPRKMSAISPSPMVKGTANFAQTRTRDGKGVS